MRTLSISLAGEHFVSFNPQVFAMVPFEVRSKGFCTGDQIQVGSFATSTSVNLSCTTQKIASEETAVSRSD